MNVRVRVAANVRHHRSRLQITQAELAVRMGVDRAYISALERGLYNPTIERLEAIATALAIDVSALLVVPPKLS